MAGHKRAFSRVRARALGKRGGFSILGSTGSRSRRYVFQILSRDRPRFEALLRASDLRAVTEAVKGFEPIDLLWMTIHNRRQPSRAGPPTPEDDPERRLPDRRGDGLLLLLLLHLTFPIWPAPGCTAELPK